MKFQSIFAATILLAVPATMAAPAMASQVGENKSSDRARFDTPSGLPVPRTVSLKTSKTYCRKGPTFSHNVKLTFMRRGLPIVVVAETHDHWRKIRDQDGDECWIHKSKLSGVKTALVVKEGLVIRHRPDPSARVVAQLGKGLIAKVEAVRGEWVQISAGGEKGWAHHSGLWGGPSKRDLSDRTD